MKKNLVSILIVSYNAEKYIERTLKSCLFQTYQEFEILVLDNASSDRTVEIIKSFNDPKIILFESEKNLGPYAGLNFLLEKAAGEYIAIQDHDDIWLPNKIEKQVSFLEKNREFIACGTNTYYYYESKEILTLNIKTPAVEFVDHTSLMFRNDGFRYDNKYLLSDEYFEKKVLAKGGGIACLPESLTIHRIKNDGTNLSSSRFKISFKNIKEFFGVNLLTPGSLLYLLDLCISRYLTKNIIWFVRKNITQRNACWVTLAEFSKRYPFVEL